MPDLTFVDLAAPGVNGISLGRQLRTMPGLATTTLIAVSDFSDDGHRGQAALEGYDDFLPKPYSPLDLAQILARVRAKIAASQETAQKTREAVAKARRRIATSRQSLDGYWRDRPGSESLRRVWFLGCHADLCRAILLTSPQRDAASHAFDSEEACLAAIDAEQRSAGRWCLIIDDTNEYIDALEVLTAFSHRGAVPLAIVLVAEGDVRRAVELMRAGAFEVLERTVAASEIGETIVLATENRASDPPAGVIGGLTLRGEGLSEQDCRLLQLTVEGVPNKQIARAMDISLRTVHLHRSALMKKVGARSRTELIRLAVQSGL